MKVKRAPLVLAREPEPFELGPDGAAEHRVFVIPPGLTEGNLAALEEDTPSPARRGTTMSPSTPGAGASASAMGPGSSPYPPAAASRASALAGEKRSGASTRVGLVVALVVVMAAGAAAWFTHLIPHP